MPRKNIVQQTNSIEIHLYRKCHNIFAGQITEYSKIVTLV